jgi:hypothetical protein
MRASRRPFRLVVVALMVGSAVASLLHGETARAQIGPGEFALHQGGTVGWVCVSADRTTEWWAYFEDVYRWADATCTAASPWDAQAQYLGAGAYGSFAAWKADVLQRAAAQGRTIVFQQHAVAEESVEN